MLHNGLVGKEIIMLTRRRFIYNTSIFVTGFCMQNLVAGEQPESSMDWFAPCPLGEHA